MLRGLFAGGLMGLVVGGASLTVASLVTEQPAGNTPPSAPQVSLPAAPEASLQSDAAPIAVDVPAEAPEVAVAEAPRAAEPMVEVAQPMMDTTSADVPEAAALVAPMDAPEPVEVPVEMTASVEEPVLPNPQALAPQAPVSEQDLIIATSPAIAPAGGDVLVVEDSETAESGARPTLEQDEIVLPALITEVVPETVPVDPIFGEALASNDTAPSTLPSGAGGVKVNRITAIKPEAEAVVAVEDTAGEATDVGALFQYSTPFENPEGKPLMGVLVLDDGTMQDPAILLKSIPFPLTVILDPSTVDVVQRMAAYRAAGLEIGVLSALPAGADPADVAVAFEATFNALPETVLMLDMGDGGLQNDRAVTEQAMEGLAASGRGVVSISKGLNAALRAAEKFNVPAGLIFRDLDGEGQDARVIRRFMDQAAFRARQDGGVILLARLRPDSISAMQLWGAANRLGQTTVAPVSAILKEQIKPE